jgi:hypothetical protein
MKPVPALKRNVVATHVRSALSSPLGWLVGGLLLALPLAARAQFAPPPPLMPQGGMVQSAPSISAGPPPEQANCIKEFMVLRQEAEKRGVAIKAAADRKAPPSELCKAFKVFTPAEEKVVLYATKNTQACGIPAEAIKQLKANHTKTIKIRDQLCNGARPNAPAPSLSEALTAQRVPDASTAKPNRGSTFDTLTGNPLVR